MSKSEIQKEIAKLRTELASTTDPALRFALEESIYTYTAILRCDKH